ncbi:COX15/CtaA family protein [Rhodohalobacter barkolensis]|uniref:Heme A synthase n=1 Tax=Rhodohalobacter barkolensis TaxID=2053187 RepID=A0A2N0VIF5_9BACT|nr:COX15/CtaA family protein [Rhodohalobacter barkolensis]PKD43973.1 heme A synthase [Rhodohalobacter barkolensis]
MKLNLYQKTAITTVLATIVLIFVGGLVRASGAGLGCPDWPQCFGMWIPPTNAADLPAQYDASLFNPLHTWLEYVNRLVGVLIGFLISLTFLFSFKYRKKDPVVTVASGAAFVMVLFQAWLGGQVVRSGLSGGMITIHMIVAMIILATLLYASFRATREKVNIQLSKKHQKTLILIAIVLFALTMIQMIIGTQVRESVDFAKNALDLPRSEWIDTVGSLYPIHRSFSWMVVVPAGLLLFYNNKFKVPSVLNRLGWATAGLILLQVVVGVSLEWFNMPGVSQILHLVGVAVLICAEMLYILLLRFSNKRVSA